MTARNASPAQAQLVHARSKSRTRSRCADYAQFEMRKATWCNQHPNATPAEFEAAMLTIAKACGI